MYRLLVILTFIGTFTYSSLATESRIRVKNGVYKRLTVAIEESVDSRLCFQTLNKIEELLTEASRAFYGMTDQQALLGEITVALPSSWADSECTQNAVKDDNAASSSADVLIKSADNPIFGSRPWAVQFGGCGEPGLRVELSHSALINKTGEEEIKLGREFLKEFIKFRFGAFEENGFPGDKLYPAFISEGEIEVPNRGCNSTSSSSLGNDEVICPSEGYNRDATTKQNILCDGRSIRELISSSSDIQINNEDEDRENEVVTSEEGVKKVFMPPRFNYAIAPKEKLFVLVLDRVALEVAASASSSSRWEVVQSALFGFVSRLPLDSKLAIVTYGVNDEATRVDLPPTIITQHNREGLHGRIPRRPLESSAGAEVVSPCLDCGLRAAFEIMRTGLKGSVVVVSSTLRQKVSADNLAFVEKENIPIFRISTSAGISNLDRYEEGLLTRFGEHFVLNGEERGDPELLSELNRVLTAVLRSMKAANVVTFHRDRRAPDIDNTITGNFVVEENLRSDLWVSALAADERDVEAFEVLSPTGVKHSFPSFVHGGARFALKGLNEPGIWSYSIRLYPTLSSHYPVHIEATAEEEEEKSVALNAWVVEADNGEIRIYASVKKGDLPVLDAEVAVTVKRPGGKNGPIRLLLSDSGTGYPDITASDGIYSAYFVDFVPESGWYEVSVSATHNGGNAKTPRSSLEMKRDAEIPCCGSELDVEFTVPTGPFNRFTSASSFHVQRSDSFYRRLSHQQRSDKLVNDEFPPSRVTDFRVEDFLAPDSLFVTLAWTAPGGDYDQGKAFRYEIRCYTSREALRDENFASMSIPVHATLIPEPEESGREQRCTVGVPWPNEVFYYAIVAFDEAGNRGKISNTIAVFIKESTSTVSPGDDADESDANEVNQPLLSGGSSFNLNGDASVVYIIIGVVAAFLVLVILGIVVVVRRRYFGLITAVLKDPELDSSDSSSSGGSSGGDINSLKKTLYGGGSVSPTSDYSSQKSPLPSISETLSWKYRAQQQRATGQEMPAVHRAAERRLISELEDVKTDCSVIYESDNSDNKCNAATAAVPDSPSNSSSISCQPPRISILEDFSVYRDLSNLNGSSGDYFSFSQLPSELQQNGRVVSVPPYYDMGTVDEVSAYKRRHESLV